MAYWLWSCPASNHGIFIWRFWSHNAKGVWFDHRLIQKIRQYNVWLKSENQGVLMEFSTQKTTATRGQDSMFLQREQLHTYRDGLQPRPKVQSQGLMCLMCVMVWAYVLYMSMWCIGGFKNTMYVGIWDQMLSIFEIWEFKLSLRDGTTAMWWSSQASRWVVAHFANERGGVVSSETTFGSVESVVGIRFFEPSAALESAAEPSNRFGRYRQLRPATLEIFIQDIPYISSMKFHLSNFKTYAVWMDLQAMLQTWWDEDCLGRRNLYFCSDLVRANSHNRLSAAVACGGQTVGGILVNLGQETQHDQHMQIFCKKIYMEPPASDFKRATLRPERCIGTANPTPAPLQCKAPRPANVQSN